MRWDLSPLRCHNSNQKKQQSVTHEVGSVTFSDVTTTNYKSKKKQQRLTDEVGSVTSSDVTATFTTAKRNNRG